MSNEEKIRIRALDTIINGSSLSEITNPLFKNYINYFDEVFNKGGILSDLNHYVEQDTKFEEFFCQSILNPVNTSVLHKAVLLRGKVGRGKTTFIRHCIEKKIPEMFDNVLIFYIDAESYRENANKKFEEKLKDSIRLELEKKFYSNLFGFQKAFVKFLGYSTKNQLTISELAMRENYNLSNLLKFLDNLEIKAGELTGGIVVVIDNLDENPRTVLEEGDSFAKELKKIAEEVCKNKSFTLLVAIREYNVRFFNTNNYPPNDLPKPSTKHIVHAKINELREKIQQETKDYVQTIDYGYRYHERSLQTKKITINGAFTIHFLNKVVGYLTESKDNEIIKLLEETSAGNLKVIVANIFNIMQSVKLPLTELFAKCFIPEDADFRIELKDPLKFDVILQCLLAIHHPYFCRDESRLMNLFNTKNSSSVNDFYCVLIIPRILFLLDDVSARTYNEIEQFFYSHGYAKVYIEKAVEKCFEKGLFDTVYGTKLNHIDRNETRMQLSSAGEYYIKKLIIEISYLQYVCEDTFVSEENYVPIAIKYNKSDSIDTKNNRLESTRQLILFVQECEERELAQIKGKNLNVQNYLNQASVIDSDQEKGIRISDYLKKNCFPRIELLKKHS
jgi:predicted DNA-binding protein